VLADAGRYTCIAPTFATHEPETCSAEPSKPVRPLVIGSSTLGVDSDTIQTASRAGRDDHGAVVLFTDAVFAIVITLLALEILLPEMFPVTREGCRGNRDDPTWT
jgi:hypothetical protein